MKRTTHVLILALGLLLVGCQGAVAADPQTDEQKTLYALGQVLAQRISGPLQRLSAEVRSFRSPDDARPALPADSANEVVLLPVFSEAADALAIDVLRACFPQRSIVPIDARALVHGLGGIHCLTQQIPSVPEQL